MSALRPPLLLVCLTLAACASTGQEQPAGALRVFPFEDRPAVGAVPDLSGAEREILLGGFSGLTFVGRDGDVLRFWTHPDRGPNSEPTDLLQDVPGDERPFPLPEFRPELIELTVDLAQGRAAVGRRVPLSAGGRPLTGLPNLQAGAPKTPHTDEVPVDLAGKRLGNDPLGADLEGIELDRRDGSFWLVDEYRPAVYHFDAEGALIDRFVPGGVAEAAGVELDGSPFGREVIPALYATRRQNRGFEGLALRTSEDGRVLLYCFLQSPLKKKAQVSRVLELDVSDPRAPVVSGQFLYPLEEAGDKVEKIGDASWVGEGRLVVVEQNSELDETGRRYLTEVDLSGATNLHTDPIEAPGGERLDDLSLETLAELGVAVLPKRRLYDLTQLKFESDKVEGMAYVPGAEPLLVVVNDDDFGLLDEHVAGDGRQPFLEPRPRAVAGVLPYPGTN